MALMPCYPTAFRAAAAGAAVTSAVVRSAARGLRRVPFAVAGASAASARAAGVASVVCVSLCAPPAANTSVVAVGAVGQARRTPTAAGSGGVSLAALPHGAASAFAADPRAAAATFFEPAAVADAYGVTAAAAAATVTRPASAAGKHPGANFTRAAPPPAPSWAVTRRAAPPVAPAQASRVHAAAASLLLPAAAPLQAAATEGTSFCTWRAAHWLTAQSDLPAAAAAPFAAVPLLCPPCRRLLAAAAPPPSDFSQKRQQSPQQLFQHLHQQRELQQRPRLLRSSHTAARRYQNTAAFTDVGENANLPPWSSPANHRSSNSSAFSNPDSSTTNGGNARTSTSESSNSRRCSSDGKGMGRATPGVSGACSTSRDSNSGGGMKRSSRRFSGSTHSTTSSCYWCNSDSVAERLPSLTNSRAAASQDAHSCSSTGSSRRGPDVDEGAPSLPPYRNQIVFVRPAASDAHQHSDCSPVAACSFPPMLQHMFRSSPVDHFLLRRNFLALANIALRNEQPKRQHQMQQKEQQQTHQQEQQQGQQQIEEQEREQQQPNSLQQRYWSRKQQQRRRQRQQLNAGLLQRFYSRGSTACGVAAGKQESRPFYALHGRLTRQTAASSHRCGACCCVSSPLLVLHRAAAAPFSSAAAVAGGPWGRQEARGGSAAAEKAENAAGAGKRRSGELPWTDVAGRNAEGLEHQKKAEGEGGAAAHGEFPWRAAILACCACVTIACAVAVQSERRKRAQTARTESDAVGKPLLGGPWTLVDSSGRLRSNSDFEGKYVLLYFGFSFCPDICPQELEKMAQVVERIDKEFGEVLQPIFITVDPQRDTVAQVQAYCREFHPRLLGFTGTQAQIKDVTRKFRVYYNEGIRSTEEDYLVDHSIIQYFLGRNGKFKDFFGKNMTAREIGDKVASYIRQDLEREKKKRGNSE